MIDILKRMDTTAVKTSTIYGLERNVDKDSTIVAAAQSKYESFVTKSQTFSILLTQAESDLATAQKNWELFLKLKSSLNALDLTANDSNLVSVVTYDDLKATILHWEAVVRQTIVAADAIHLAAEYITDKKASNPLISNDLVVDITNADKAAAQTVTVVIGAFTDALTALSFTEQAKNSTSLATIYIDEAKSELLNLIKGLNETKAEAFKKDLKFIQSLDLPSVPEADEKDLIELLFPSLEKTLEKKLLGEQKKVKAARAANENASKEVVIAQEELAKAEAKLSSAAAALQAAKAAVAG